MNTEACPACGHKAHPETPGECNSCPEGYCEAPAQTWPDPLPPGFIVPVPTPFRAPGALAEFRELVSKREEALAWVARASADDGELDAAAGAFEVVQDKLAARAGRLLAAVEAALAHHVEAVIEDVPVPRFRYCKTCSGHPAWPCPEVEAITAALAGKEPDHG